MTADLCALAVQDGKLDWESTVGGVLGADVACAYAGVTLRQLLQHTSGVPPGDCPPDEWRLAWSLHFGSRFFGRQSPAAQQLKFVRTILSRVPPARPPGPPSAYSNQNYAIAAAMLARATGVDWAQLARARLFEPLGMGSAGLGPAGCGADFHRQGELLSVHRSKESRSRPAGTEGQVVSFASVPGPSLV